MNVIPLFVCRKKFVTITNYVMNRIPPILMAATVLRCVLQFLTDAIKMMMMMIMILLLSYDFWTTAAIRKSLTVPHSSDVCRRQLGGDAWPARRQTYGYLPAPEHCLCPVLISRPAQGRRLLT